MKKKHKIIILSLIIICVICLSIILYKVFNKPESRQININYDEVEYIEIKYHNKTSEIVNKETITEIIDNLNKLRIEKHKENIIEQLFYTSSNVYKVKIYNDKENRTLKYEMVIKSDDKMTLDNVSYKIKNKTDIYEYLKDKELYCKKALPEETEKNVYKFQVNGLKNIDKTEFINTYNEMTDAKPIKESEMQESEKYIEMETYDDDKIVVYYVDSRVYIKYAYKNYVVYFMYQDNSLN